MLRLVVWLLASTSFASLLGELYGLMPLARGWWLLSLPGLIGLALIAWFHRREPMGPKNPWSWIVIGAVTGIFAAVIYDVFRLPFVLSGYPLFAVFPRFGQMLLARDGSDPAIHIVGWAYHFSNGAALGIMLLAMLPRWNRAWLITTVAVVWALVVESLLLLSPYYTFFKLNLPYGLFIVLTLSAHAVFGLALGWAVVRWTRQYRSHKPT